MPGLMYVTKRTKLRCETIANFLASSTLSSRLSRASAPHRPLPTTVAKNLSLFHGLRVLFALSPRRRQPAIPNRMMPAENAYQHIAYFTDTSLTRWRLTDYLATVPHAPPVNAISKWVNGLRAIVECTGACCTEEMKTQALIEGGRYFLTVSF